MESILRAVNLKKTFEKDGQVVKAVSGVDLEIKKGDFVSLQGPSGSGKTTLLNILGCLDSPTSGKVYLQGDEVTSLSERKLAGIRGNQIGFVFQSFNLIPILNAMENVELPLERTGMSKADRRDRACDLLEMVGLEERLLHRPAQLSAGEKQRVAIARALANNPAVLMADEPTGNLDTRTSWKIMDLLTKLNKDDKVTTVMVTHDARMAKLAKKRYYMTDGKLDTSGSRGRSDDISEQLGLKPKTVGHLMSAGFDEIEAILDMGEDDLRSIKHFRRKDVKHIMNRIEKYKRHYEKR